MAVLRMEVERIGPVALLALGSAVLDAPLRAQIMSTLDALEDDADVRAIVLVLPACDATAATLDTSPETTPALADLCTTLEAFGRPIVAALTGCASGTLAELALSAHFRLRGEGPCLALSAIETGTLEGGGATQRLPRLGGAAFALEALLGGTPLSAEAACTAGVLDGVVQGDVIEAALSLAEKLAQADAPPRPARLRNEALSDRAAFHDAVETARKRYDTPPANRIIECVEAALVLPFDAGVAFERAAAEALRQAPEAAALRHVVSAERKVAASVEVTANPLPIRHVSVHAGDTTAAPFALALLRAGVEVTVAEHAPGREMLSRIGEELARDVADGRCDEATRRAHLTRLHAGRSGGGACGDLALRFMAQDGRVPRLMCHPSGGPEPIRVTVVPADDPLDVAAEVNGTELHLAMTERFRPGSLAELLPGVASSPSVVSSVTGLLRLIGAFPIVSGQSTLSIAGVLTSRLRTAADHLLEDGATPQSIDAALEAAGYSLGPYRRLDCEGLSGVHRRRRARAEMRDPRDRYVPVLDRLCATGRWGKEAGQGYYDYPDGIPEGLASGAVGRIVQDVRSAAGVAPRPISAAEIVDRCQLALISAGFSALGSGVAKSPTDVDLVAVHGLGFPRSLGGPMYQAGLLGLAEVHGRLLELAQRADARFWAPPRFLERMVVRGAASGFPHGAPAA
ncbi:3-hydroxyacyl-CoA dehydrogenase family protein [Tropicimonas marinistellae]|uniref:3-hydroxyacyl-CoA dehydrogenase family protein n=1 Tax=Tropicimonas marinistellae TaxID=1739787 RepID=UPI000831BFF1|nr:3-hydroxyacyl-CoA dehydrogenase family protein [Tropicimonas marinistellae]